MKEQKTYAMISLAGIYTQSIVKNGKIFKEFDLKHKPLSDFFNLIAKNLYDYCESNDEKNLFASVTDALMNFFRAFSRKEYLYICSKDFIDIYTNDFCLPIVMLLDYYSDSAPIEVSYCERKLEWSDILLLNYYYNNIPSSYIKGSNTIIDYVIGFILDMKIENPTADDMLKFNAVYFEILNRLIPEKFFQTSNSLIKKNLNKVSSIMMESYDVKEAVSDTLSSYIREISPLLKDELIFINSYREKNEIKNWYKLGTLDIKNISCVPVIMDGIIQIDYILNGTNRSFLLDLNRADNVQSFLFYPDMIAAILAIKYAKGLYSGQIAAISKRYSLMLFRAVPLDGDEYSEFLSLIEE